MNEEIREYKDSDLGQMVEIWNEIVEGGEAFPQKDPLDIDSARLFFSEQSFTGVLAEDDQILGLYILHPNNVGRCGHIANSSYAVKSGQRGRKLGEKQILHSLETAKKMQFRVLQFNAVTVTNKGALHLYKKLGFSQLGVIPGGFLSKSGEYVDIIPHYIELK
jgi:L-amino acid N-acyltransferase YncA